jgi:hypothetical protein
VGTLSAASGILGPDLSGLLTASRSRKRPRTSAPPRCAACLSREQLPAHGPASLEAETANEQIGTTVGTWKNEARRFSASDGPEVTQLGNLSALHDDKAVHGPLLG